MTRDGPTLQNIFEKYSLTLLALLITLIVFISLLTQSPVFNVFFGFAPTLLTVMLGFFLYEETKIGKFSAWILPLILIPGFYALWTSNLVLEESLLAADLAAVNLLLSVSYLALFYLIAPTLHERAQEKHKDKTRTDVEKAQRKAPKHTYKPQLPKTNYNRAVLIGEKCKSLNYAMGQVYDRSSGVEKETRNKIRFQREAYNGLVSYYEAKEDGDEPDISRSKARQHVKEILKTLHKIRQPEKKIFGSKSKEFKNLKRDEEGTTKIVDVLAENSRSPVYAAVQTLKDSAKAVKKDLEE